MTHRSRTTLIALLLLTAAMGIACSSTQTLGEQIDDAAITAKVKTKLAADPEINPFRIDVDTENGVVRLSGTVEKPTTRTEAERMARSTAGVTRVINDVEVGDPSLGDRLDNAQLAASVKAKIVADPDLNPFNIDVDVENGVVTLMGRVINERNREHAEDIARTTGGVVDVKNLLEVEDEA